MESTTFPLKNWWEWNNGDSIVPFPNPHQINTYRVAWQVIAKECGKPGPFENLTLDLIQNPFGATAVIDEIERQYHHFRNVHDKEPENIYWEGTSPVSFESLPELLRNHIRAGYIWHHDSVYHIITSLPYAGIGYMVPDNSTSIELRKIIPFERLFGVKQLAYLHDPVLREKGRKVTRALQFEHTRGVHSLDVEMLMTVLGKLLGMSEYGILHGSLAGLTHDLFTPAGGDATKLVDYPTFDEEVHYADMFKIPGWDIFREKHSISEELLFQTIRNQGFLGRLLDVADKIAYVSRDTSVILAGAYEYQNRFHKPHYSEGYHLIGELVSKNPHLCHVWKDITRKDEQIAFTDGDRLADFLTLRALLFKHLYYNPTSRFFEYMFGKGITSYLYRNGILTRENLLEMTDNELEEVMGQHTEIFYPLQFVGKLGDAEYNTFRTKSGMYSFLNKKKKDKGVLVLADDFTPKTSTSVQKFFVQKRSGIIRFDRAYPRVAEKIGKIMTFPKQNGVYLLSMNDLGVPLSERKKLKKMVE